MRSDVALGLEGAIIRTALEVALGLQEAITRKALLPAEPQRSPESKDFFIRGLLKNAISQVLQGYPRLVAYSTIKEGSCGGLIRRARACVRSDVALGLLKAIIRKALHVALGLQEITRKSLLPPPESTDFFIKGLLKNAISQVLQGYHPLSVAYCTINKGSCKGLIRRARPACVVRCGSGFGRSNHYDNSASGSGFARSNHKARPPESKHFFIKGILKNAISEVLQGYPLSVAGLHERVRCLQRMIAQ